MSNGSKIVAISAVALLGVAGVYYIASAPSASNNKSSTTAKESGAPSTTGAVASNSQTNMPPTLTLSPTVPGTAAGTTGTNGLGASPTPTGTVANAGARPQPPFVPGAATSAGTGKGDVPGAATNGAAIATNGNANPNFAGAANTGSANTGGVGTPTNTAAPRVVNGITIPASGSASGSFSGSATNPGASGAGAPTTTPSGTTLATGSPTPTGAGLPTGPTPTGSLSVTPTTAASSSNAERTHVIASGDTFEALAQKYFNDSTKWQLIAKANPTVEPERLKIGQKIRIPAGGSTATLAADTSAQSVTSPARSINTSGGSFHTVAKGETPSSISRKYYGSDKYWRQILAANKGTTEKNLKVGQKLTIPAKDTIVGAENVGGRGS